MNQPGSMPPPMPPATPKRAETWYDRLIRSKRVRIFFVAAIVFHVAAVALISSNKRLYDMLLGQEESKQRESTPWELQEAMDKLLSTFKKYLNDSLRELVDIRARLDRAQYTRMQRMMDEDKDRKEKIANKVWPSATKPIVTAKFFWRVDPDNLPPRFAFESVGDIEAMDFIELYRAHVKIEAEIGKVYERYHALELASSLDEPIVLHQAIKNTKLTMPKRREIQAKLLDTTKITSNIGEPFKLFREELKECYLDTQDILNTCKRWLEMAEGRIGTGGGTTLFGPSINVVPPPSAYYGHYLNPRLLRKVEHVRLIDPPVSLGNRIGDNGDIDQWTRIKDADGKPVLDAAGKPLIPDWMSIDRWYIVGPFAHPGAQRRMDDLERKYPPEAHPDMLEKGTYVRLLDDVYKSQTKTGAELRWKYRHIGADFLEKGIRVQPFTVDNCAYGIWYFYSEVYSDKRRTVLASFASDDYGVCYVNGQRVYTSPPDQQPWVPFTKHGFVKVTLKQGFNTFLFKLENATGTTDLSAILMTYEDQDLIDAATKEN